MNCHVKANMQNMMFWVLWNTHPPPPPPRRSQSPTGWFWITACSLVLRANTKGAALISFDVTHFLTWKSFAGQWCWGRGRREAGRESRHWGLGGAGGAGGMSQLLSGLRFPCRDGRRSPGMIILILNGYIFFLVLLLISKWVTFKIFALFYLPICLISHCFLHL